MSIALVLSAAAAWGAPRSDVKPYRLSSASPTSVPVGTSAGFSVTIGNESTQQQIGSVNIRVPEFVVTGAQASPDGSAAQFRNLSLPPGGSTTLAFSATASCRSGGPYNWSVTVKQSNDFNGPPGNDFVAASGSATPATSITGSCKLVFGAQPTDTSGPGVAITSVALTPTGAPVTVRVLDDANNQVTGSGVAISLGLALNGGGATGFGATASTVGGVASFPGISVNKYGTYRLSASSTGMTSAVSALFNVWQTVEDCAISDCSVTSFVNNSFSSTLSSGATAGTLGVSLGGRQKPECGSGGIYDTMFNHAPNTVTGNAYGTAADAQKIVTLVVEKKQDQKQPNNGVSFYEVCYAAPVAQADAGPAKYGAPNQDPLTGEWVWVLPDCGPQVPGGAACVVSKNKDNAGRVVITFRLAAGDPTWW